MDSRSTSKATEVITLLRGRSGVFAVLANKRFIVVDTSTQGYRKRLFSKVDELLARDNELMGLILTHTHFDHAENAAAFIKCYQVPLYCHKDEVEYLRKGESPEVRGSFALMRFVTNTFQTLFERFGRFEPVEPSNTFSESFNLHELGIPAVLFHTPGHTPGSSTLIIDDEIALAGDTLFGVVPNRVFPPFVANERLLLSSWEHLLGTGSTHFLPAHGGIRTREQLAAGLARRRNTAAHAQDD